MGASSSAASSPSPVCGGPSQPGSEGMSLESSSGEADMASSSPSPDSAGPSQKEIPHQHLPSNRWGGVPPVKSWTSPELLTEMVDDEDDGDDFWKIIREIKVAIAGKSELIQDPKGTSAPLLEDTDDSYLRDDKSLLEAFSETRPRRRPVPRFTLVLPMCEEVPEEDQETSGVKHCTEPDSEQSLELHLESEPLQDSTPVQTPAQQLLLLDQAVGEEEAAGGQGGRGPSVEEEQDCSMTLEQHVEETAPQEGSQKREEEFCSPFRRLTKTFRRLLGRRGGKVEPLNFSATQNVGQQHSQMQNAPRRTALRRILSCVCCCCK
ncbi:uncharacterized protein LOC134458912 [Engraulis encrasicolus]|uniref:uncharacterized protein LOC134458912 n=1 Tax=Engraulis encrasicolus TaxID=184585 RepID=UPI002FD10CC4